ncbi:MAG: winged helix-turn-helix domain-containing protein [Patescibacteria group bacterium]
MKKTNRELERIIKGFANHRRLQILALLKKEPELSVGEVAQKVKSDEKNISSHVNRMATSGLVMKRSDNKSVRLKLTKRGNNILTFVRMLE